MQRLRQFDSIAMAVAENILKEARAKGYAEVVTAARLPAQVPHTRLLHRLIAGYVSFFAADYPDHQVIDDDQVLRVRIGAP